MAPRGRARGTAREIGGPRGAAKRIGESEAAAGRRIDRIVRRLRGSMNWRRPAVSEIARQRRDPYRVLVSTLLSLRTKDEVTHAASGRLLREAPDPKRLLALSVRRIEQLIHPVGFYRTKARRLREVARILLEEHAGEVPGTPEALLALPGVGRKTANLVLLEGYGVPAIAVDTHVHRISNRLGIVHTTSPVQTEAALARVLPRRHWITYNELLVGFGQSICRPLSPFCSRCPVATTCPRVDVTRYR